MSNSSGVYLYVLLKQAKTKPVSGSPASLRDGAGAIARDASTGKKLLGEVQDSFAEMGAFAAGNGHRVGDQEIQVRRAHCPREAEKADVHRCGPGGENSRPAFGGEAHQVHRNIDFAVPHQARDVAIVLILDGNKFVKAAQGARPDFAVVRRAPADANGFESRAIEALPDGGQVLRNRMIAEIGRKPRDANSLMAVVFTGP